MQSHKYELEDLGKNDLSIQVQMVGMTNTKIYSKLLKYV